MTRDDRMEVEGSLQISNLKSSDAGFYICKATNEAKSVEKSAYLSVQCMFSISMLFHCTTYVENLYVISVYNVCTQFL